MIENLLLWAIVFFIGLVAIWRTKDEAKAFSPHKYDDSVIEFINGRCTLVDKRG